MVEGEVLEEWEQEGKVIRFRHPRWQDLDQYIEMHNTLHAEQIMASHWETDRKKGCELLSRCLTGDEVGDSSHLIVEVDGTIVGEGWVAKSGGYQSCDLGITIIGRYQGMGIGTRLMNALEQEARRMGMARIDLTVWGANGPAYHVYTKCGFVEMGRFPNWIRSDQAPGGFSDLVWMVKDLRPLD